MGQTLGQQLERQKEIVDFQDWLDEQDPRRIKYWMIDQFYKDKLKGSEVLAQFKCHQADARKKGDS